MDKKTRATITLVSLAILVVLVDKFRDHVPIIDMYGMDVVDQVAVCLFLISLNLAIARKLGKKPIALHWTVLAGLPIGYGTEVAQFFGISLPVTGVGTFHPPDFLAFTLGGIIAYFLGRFILGAPDE